MNDDQIDDLKQFITATVSQSEMRLEQKIGSLATKLENLEKKMDDVFASIIDAIEQINTKIYVIDSRATTLENQIT